MKNAVEATYEKRRKRENTAIDDARRGRTMPRWDDRETLQSNIQANPQQLKIKLKNDESTDKSGNKKKKARRTGPQSQNDFGI